MLTDALRALLKSSTYPPQPVQLTSELRDEINLQLLRELKSLNGKISFFVVLTVLTLIAQILL
jgi:hypothetical protein